MILAARLLGLAQALVLGLGPAGESGPAPKPVAGDLEFLLCRAAHEQALVELRWPEWSYTKTDTREKLDAGRVASRSMTTKRVHRSPSGVPVNQTLSIDSRPLTGKAAEEAEAYFKSRMEQLATDSGERARSVGREVREADDKVAVLEVVPSAFDWRYEGFDFIGDEPCWVVSFLPRKDFKPWSKDQAILDNFAGVAWVSADKLYFRRLDADFIDSVSIKFGPFATLTPGSHLLLQNSEVEPGTVMTSAVDLDLKIRILFVFGRYERRGTYYSDWQRAFPPHALFAP